jgi:hypothetical protein
MPSRDLLRVLWMMATGRGARASEITELAGQLRRAEPLA